MNSSSQIPGALRRREEIRRLVRRTPVRSQEELQELLASRGYEVAQPTLSRDLRELGLAKTPAGYVDPTDGAAGAFSPAESREHRFLRLMAEFGLSAVPAAAIVVVKTPPGAAQPVALALDAAELPDVTGTISGDDTIFVATPSAAAARRVAARLQAALPRPLRRPRG